MPESVGDNTSDIDNRFDEIIGLEMDSYFPVYRRFDKARLELYAQLSCLSSDTLDRQTAESIDIVGVTERFGTLLPYVLDESDGAESFIERVVYFIHEDSTIRSLMIEHVLGAKNQLVLSPDKVTEKFHEFVYKADTTKQSLEQIVAFYDNDLKADINYLVAGLSKNEHHALHGANDDVTTLEIKKQHLDHVVDVAKIVAGVTIAIALDKLFRRGR